MNLSFLIQLTVFQENYKFQYKSKKLLVAVIISAELFDFI